MDIKAAFVSLSPKFEGVKPHKFEVIGSRLHVTATVEASIDLPGDSDNVVSEILNMALLGNLPTSSDSAQA